MPFSCSEMVILSRSIHLVSHRSNPREREKREPIGRGKSKPPSSSPRMAPSSENKKKKKEPRRKILMKSKFLVLVSKREIEKGWAFFFSLLSNRYVKPIGRRERHHDVCYLFQIRLHGPYHNERANDSLFPQTCFFSLFFSPGKKLLFQWLNV